MGRPRGWSSEGLRPERGIEEGFLGEGLDLRGSRRVSGRFWIALRVGGFGVWWSGWRVRN